MREAVLLIRETVRIETDANGVWQIEIRSYSDGTETVRRIWLRPCGGYAAFAPSFLVAQLKEEIAALSRQALAPECPGRK